MAPDKMPRLNEIGVDLGVVGFTLALTIIPGLAVGLVPALQASKPNLNETLKEGGRNSGSGARQRLRSILVVAEIAVSLVLLIGASLLMRSFVRLSHVDPGFDTQNAISAVISLPQQRYRRPEQSIAFFEQVVEKVANLPGVEAVGAVDLFPMINGNIYGVQVEGRPPAAPEESDGANCYSVTSGYVRAM